MSLNSLANIPGYEELPAGSPPPGVIPNFENPESRAPQVCAVSAVCLTILFVVAAIRGYSKTKLLKMRTTDDIPFFIAAALCLVYTISIIVLVSRGGFGQHTWDVQIKVFDASQLRLALVISILIGIILWSIKVPLILMYLEIFGRIRWVKYLSWIVMVLTGVFNLACVTAVAVTCSPRTGTSQLDYLSVLISPSCEVPRETLSLISGCVNVAFDVFLLVLPLQPIWSLQLSTSRKLAVSALVLTGIFAIIASCVALWARIVERNATWSKNSDNSWDIVPLWIATIAEMTCAVAIAAAPSISVFWRLRIAPMSSKYSSVRDRLFSHYKSSTLQHRDSDSQVELAKHKRGDVSAIMMTREFSVQGTYAEV